MQFEDFAELARSRDYFPSFCFSAGLYRGLRRGFRLEQSSKQVVEFLLVDFRHKLILLPSTRACGYAMGKLHLIRCTPTPKMKKTLAFQ
jgi:hypothetical protein